MSVTVRVAAAKPIQPVRAASVDAASQSVPSLPPRTRTSPGREKAKHVEEHENNEAPEPECQCRRIHRRCSLAIAVC